MGESLSYLRDKVTFRWYIRKVFIVWSYFFDFIRNGEARLVWIMLKSLLSNKSNSKDLIVQTHFGKLFIRKNTMDFKMANRTYEKRVVKVFEDELKGKDLVLDVGANTGLYTVIAGKHNVRTYAFEPIDDNFKVLSKNIEINNLDGNVNPLNFGLGLYNEKQVFNFNEFNTGAASIYRIRLKTIEKEGEIKRFDDLDIIDSNNIRSLLVKLDVEGMETYAIEGMSKFIQTIPNVSVIVETKHVGVDIIQQSLTDIDKFEFTKIDSFNMLAKKSTK